MPEFALLCNWQMTAEVKVKVKGDTLEEAQESLRVAPLPPNGEYVDDSFLILDLVSIEGQRRYPCVQPPTGVLQSHRPFRTWRRHCDKRPSPAWATVCDCMT